jgi:hypothetical protein
MKKQQLISLLTVNPGYRTWCPSSNSHSLTLHNLDARSLIWSNCFGLESKTIIIMTTSEVVGQISLLPCLLKYKSEDQPCLCSSSHSSSQRSDVGSYGAALYRRLSRISKWVHCCEVLVIRTDLCMTEGCTNVARQTWDLYIDGYRDLLTENIELPKHHQIQEPLSLTQKGAKFFSQNEFRLYISYSS